MLSRVVGSVVHLWCRIKGKVTKGKIIFNHEFSAVFSQQPLALTVVGGKHSFFNVGLRKIFCLKRTHSSCSRGVSQHRCEVEWLGFPCSAASRALHCLKHQCSAVLADLKHPGLQRARDSPPSWITWAFSCKCKDLRFISPVLFCICLGDSSEILTPGKGIRESQSATPSLHVLEGWDF